MKWKSAKEQLHTNLMLFVVIGVGYYFAHRFSLNLSTGNHAGDTCIVDYVPIPF